MLVRPSGGKLLGTAVKILAVVSHGCGKNICYTKMMQKNNGNKDQINFFSLS